MSRVSLVEALLFHHVTVSLPILNEHDSYEYEKNQ